VETLRAGVATVVTFSDLTDVKRRVTVGYRGKAHFAD
jgi:hypothetical protein